MKALFHSRHVTAMAIPVIWVYCVCLACGPPPAVKPSSGMSRSSFEADRAYDDPPLTEAELAGMGGTQTNRRPAPTPDEPTIRSETPSRKAVRGYRVQVHSFRDRKTADIARRQLQQQLEDLSGVRVHIEEEPSSYKIRVGDCLTKAEAEKLMRTLRTRKGYPDAWIVETLVYP